MPSRRQVMAVLSAGAILVPPQPAQWSLGAPTGRVGGSGGDRAAELTRVSEVIAAGDDSVYVVDDKTDGVLLFDGRGRLLRKLGRRGAGPGEFGYGPGRIGVLTDTVWANGPMHRRR